MKVFEMTDLGLMVYFLGLQSYEYSNEPKGKVFQRRWNRKVSQKKFRLNGSSDSDWGGAPDMKSTSGFCFNLESGAFSGIQETSYYYNQQPGQIIAATAAAVNQELWLRKIMCDMKMEQK
ncbi:hypothetical protein KY284_001128 [Solanum tuberosum]|nr:hypothetical protein KY284_001128 [Solanum tuberosum]